MRSLLRAVAVVVTVALGLVAPTLESQAQEPLGPASKWLIASDMDNGSPSP